MQLYSQGHIKPIRPIHGFPAERLTEAFRLMQGGQHMGKIVVAMPERAAEIAAARAPQQLALSGEATYFLVGGLGASARPSPRGWSNGAREAFCSCPARRASPRPTGSSSESLSRRVVALLPWRALSRSSPMSERPSGPRQRESPASLTYPWF